MKESTKNKLVAKFMEMLDGPLSLQKAIAVAVVMHGDQEDKGKCAYIRHPLRVMEQLQTEDEMICGIMHDALEDTDLTIDDLVNLGFTVSQIKVIDSLTKKFGPDFSQEKYIEDIKKSPLARKIKILDMKDNCRVDRLKNKTLTEKDMARYQKYIWDLDKLGAI